MIIKKQLGDAIKNSSVKRKDIFLTTKLWFSNYTFEKATKAIDQDLKELEHEVSPAIDQIEVNPWFQQKNDVKYFQGRNIAIEA